MFQAGLNAYYNSVRCCEDNYNVYPQVHVIGEIKANTLCTLNEVPDWDIFDVMLMQFLVYRLSANQLIFDKYL